MDVPFDRTRAEVQLFSDRLVRAALGDQRQHRALALCELVECRPSMAVDEALDHLGVERGAPEATRSTASMAEVAGEPWKLEYEQAWSAAFDVVAGAMLDGAEEAELEAVV